MKHLIKKILREENDSDWGWVSDVPTIVDTIFYSESRTGLYDNWTVGHDIWRLLTEAGITWNTWNSRGKIYRDDDTKLYNRFFLKVDDNKKLTFGSEYEKFSDIMETEFFPKRIKGYTIINVDEKHN